MKKFYRSCAIAILCLAALSLSTGCVATVEPGIGVYTSPGYYYARPRYYRHYRYYNYYHY